MSKRYIWMAVTDDQYELPLCVQENVTDLATWLGLTKSAIMKMQKKGNMKTYSRPIRIVKVEK